MDNNQRDEIHKTIWKIACDLREGDGGNWDFKDYVLGIMFYRFISENLANYINENEKRANSGAPNYEDLSDDLAKKKRSFNK
ncbi:type I restriction-modification system subunit M N-terminal domain-containing protein [Mycoplasma struthionis]|uniref:type I restriction-modification system subunit M N-terminal domain-containing protein n=1 Tax=Mycoplasma struthionis TaxID=538220 RepID=UPI0021BD9C50|nr:type I restriction-modification system subunit M N-terminal domain-containing protein [Mycoplasma struthionis]